MLLKTHLFLPMLGAAIYLLSVLAGWFVVYQWVDDGVFRPIQYIVPQTATTQTAPPGGNIEVDATVCNSSTDAIAVRGSSYWRNLDTSALTVYRTEADGVLAPGCTDRHFSNPVPLTLIPGRYRIEGIVSAFEGTRVQRTAWYTTDFCIAGGGGC